MRRSRWGPWTFGNSRLGPKSRPFSSAAAAPTRVYLFFVVFGFLSLAACSSSAPYSRHGYSVGHDNWSWVLAFNSWFHGNFNIFPAHQLFCPSTNRPASARHFEFGKFPTFAKNSWFVVISLVKIRSVILSQTSLPFRSSVMSYENVQFTQKSHYLCDL